MTQVLMKQCLLQRGVTTQTAWIPSRFATVGKTVTITPRGEPGLNWVVAEVYPREATWDFVSDRSQDYKKTRAASDI